MPKLDHTGPEGKGPKTGRKLGQCHKNETELKESGELGIGQGKRRHAKDTSVQDKGKRFNYFKTLFKKENKMKIAVPLTKNFQIDEHFGHCEFYGIYSISEKNEITNTETIKSVEGCGCKSNIASVLYEKGVTIMLAGGIGGGAINVLNNAGIEVIRGCSGDATKIVEQFIKGNIIDSGSSCQQHENHHGNGQDHVCNH